MRYVIFLTLLFLIGCGTQSEVIKQPIGYTVEIVREVSEDNNVEPRVYFCPRDNCSAHLVELIESSEVGVHCALFDLDLENVIDVSGLNGFG